MSKQKSKISLSTAATLLVTSSLWLTPAKAVGAEAEAAAPADAEAEAEAKPKWETTATAGVTLTKGNSDTLMIAIAAASERKWGQNELELNAGLTYGEDRDNVTASTIFGKASYNRLISERAYVNGLLGAVHDDLADLAYRVTLSPAAGYYFVKNQKITLSGEAGPGIVFEKLGGMASNYWTLRLTERFTWQINDRAKLWQSFTYTPRVDDFGDYVLTGEIGFQTDITQKLALTVQLIDAYRSVPAPTRKKNDLRLISGITYKF